MYSAKELSDHKVELVGTLFLLEKGVLCPKVWKKTGSNKINKILHTLGLSSLRRIPQLPLVMETHSHRAPVTKSQEDLWKWMS